MKKGKKVVFREVGLQVGLQSGVTFLEKWSYKTLAKPPPVERLPANKKGGVDIRNRHFASNFASALHLIIYRDLGQKWAF